jgi:hypothetical protein
MVLKSIGVLVSWPIVILVIALIYRNGIGRALERLLKYKGFGHELEFGQKIAELEEVAATTIAGVLASTLDDAVLAGSGYTRVTSTPDIEPKAEDEAQPEDEAQAEDEPKPIGIPEAPVEWPSLGQLEWLAESAPSYTILMTWERLTETISQIARIDGILRTQDTSQSVMILRKAGIMSPAAFKEYQALQDLRNRVAHGRHQPLPGEALAYVVLANGLREKLMSMARNPPTTLEAIKLLRHADTPVNDQK